MRKAARKAVEPLAWSDIVTQFERELAGPSVTPSVPTSPTLLHAHA